MSNEEIQEGNKLISEFMCIRNDDGTIYTNEKGGYQEGTLHFNTVGLSLNYLVPKGDKYFDKNYGKWERDWSYLMPVVHKISEFKTDDDILFIEAQNICDTPIGNSIETIYGRVVRFIKLYNDSKK